MTEDVLLKVVQMPDGAVAFLKQDIGEAELDSLFYSMLESARNNSMIDNLVRLVANVRRSEAPNDIDNVQPLGITEE